SRKRDLLRQWRAVNRNRNILPPPVRIHTLAPHRHTSCDGAPEKSPALARRKPGTPIDPLQSASYGTPRDITSSRSIKPKEPEQHAGDVGGKSAVVHANVDRGVERRRRGPRV